MGCPEKCRGRLSIAWLQQGLLASRKAHPLLPPRALESSDEIPEGDPVCKQACTQLPELVLPTLWCRPSLEPKEIKVGLEGKAANKNFNKLNLNLKIGLIWSRNLTPGHISREISNSKRSMYPKVHNSTIYNSQDMEATEVSINRWMNRENVVHIYSGVLLSHKNEITPFPATWMDLAIITPSEVSQTKTNVLLYHIHVESNLWHKWIYLWNRNWLTDIENKLIFTKREKEWRNNRLRVLWLADRNCYI